MKLFWREHLPWIIFATAQLIIVVVLFWLDGYRDLTIIGYACFLSVLGMLGYLAYRYYTHRRMYICLSHPTASQDEFIQNLDAAPLSEALSRFLTSQYRHYYDRRQTWERKQQNHLTFMNQWVHQMKTPLSVIELITQEEADSHMASISAEADRIRKGLEMVLYMARLETFEHDFHVERVNVRELVNEVIGDNKRMFIRNHVYPEIRIAPDLVVETDAKWLNFILQQLLSNAIKYSAESHGKITVTGFTEGRAVWLEVSDQGAGIPATDLSRVFRPFFTGENGRKFKESTGMGLYLVKEVIDKLNHTIHIQSKPGRGTTVRIQFSSSHQA